MDNQNNQLDENLEKDILQTVQEELTLLKVKKKKNYLKNIIPSKIPRPEITKKIKKNTVIGVAIVTLTCIITVFSVGYFFPKQKTIVINGKTQPAFTTTKLTTGNPSYKTIIPSNKTIGSLGGWKRISPESADPVYAYSDKINNITIAVSEQPLPDNFKENTAAQIEKMALNFNATDKVTVGNTVVYIGTSGDGPQSVIFTKKDLLVLIKSSSKISDADWANYINGLN